MPRTVKIDSALNLGGTTKRCEQVQRAGYKLASIKDKRDNTSGTVLMFNEAKFADASAIDILNELNFVPAEEAETLASVKQRTPGWTFIFDAKSMYVQDGLKRVVIFGKKTP